MYIIQNMAFLWRGQLDLLKIGFFLSIPMYILIIWREKYWYMEKSIATASEGLWYNVYFRYQKFFWKLVDVLLVLIIFYKMNTDNDTLLKFWFHVAILITKQVQSWKNLTSSQRLQLWTCFVIKPVLKWNQNLSKASLSVFIL